MNNQKYKLLLSPDGTDSSDPLDTNVNDIDISYPLLPAQMYEMRIEDAVKETNKAGTGENLVLTLKTTTAATSTKGEPVAAGFTLKHRISLTETAKYNKTSIAKNLAKVGRWARQSVTARQLMDNPTVLVGATGLVDVAVNKATAEYKESNGVKDFPVVS